MPTIKDVAQAAGVSTATVSYVLNGTKQVSPEIETRVFEAAAALKYSPNAAARNLRKQENRIIGYELPMFVDGDIGTMMHQFIYQLAIAAERMNYHLMTFAPEPNRSVVNIYQRLILTNRVDGFVLSDTNWDDPRIEMLMDSDMPFVAFGRANPRYEFAYIDVDGRDGMRQVTEHLLEQGHRHFAFIGWRPGSVSGDSRYAGYCETLQRTGVPVDTALERRVCNSVDAGYAAAADIMGIAAPPTALVCVSDVIAVGAVRYLNEHGYRVGTDVAVTGFDDITVAEFLSPSLTTVHQPLTVIGEQLIQMLVAYINKDGLPAHEQQVLLAPRLIVRESSVPRAP